MHRKAFSILTLVKLFMNILSFKYLKSLLKLYCFFFFLMWTIFKVFIEFVTILLLFCVLVFWLGGMWDLSSPTRDQTIPPALEGEILTTGPPGKSLVFVVFVKSQTSLIVLLMTVDWEICNHIFPEILLGSFMA